MYYILHKKYIVIPMNDDEQAKVNGVDALL